MDRIALTAKETAQLLGICMGNMYALIHRDGFPVIWLSPRRCAIPIDGLRRWLDEEAAKGANWLEPGRSRNAH